MEVALADTAQRRIQWRNDRGNNDAVNLLRLEPLHGEQVTKKHTVFVDGLRSKSRDPPIGNQLVVTSAGRFRKDAQDCVGVPDIEDKKHKWLVTHTEFNGCAVVKLEKRV